VADTAVAFLGQTFGVDHIYIFLKIIKIHSQARAARKNPPKSKNNVNPPVFLHTNAPRWHDRKNRQNPENSSIKPLFYGKPPKKNAKIPVDSRCII
jgi:hypothetical protein